MKVSVQLQSKQHRGSQNSQPASCGPTKAAGKPHRVSASGRSHTSMLAGERGTALCPGCVFCASSIWFTILVYDVLRGTHHSQSYCFIL